MSAPRYHSLRVLVAHRDYADASGATSGASGRRCPRCAARLRRGNTSYHGLCAPCTLALALPSPASTSPRVCPECGLSKHYYSARCRSCADAHRYHQEAP